MWTTGKTTPPFNSGANPTLDEPIAQQGKGPVTDIRILHGDFWPQDEPIEDFLAALHEWRGHNKTDRAASGFGESEPLAT